MPPLGCIRREGERWKIEEWFEQILKDKDGQKKTRAPGHPTSLVTTIRSSSEEKEWHLVLLNGVVENGVVQK